MTPSAVPGYAGYRFAAEVSSHAVWLYFRVSLGLRMVDELLAARGIIVSHDRAPVGAEVRPGVREPDPLQAACSRGQVAQGRSRADDLWVKHWLWRAVDRTGMVLDILVQSRRDTGRQTPAELARHGAARREVMPSGEHGKHKG